MSVKSNSRHRKWVHIDGYWLDTMDSPFQDYLCAIGGAYKEEKDGDHDDQVFYYFDDMEHFKSYLATAKGLKDRDDDEFVITAHTFVQKPEF
jgi:hypothetical protein